MVGRTVEAGDGRRLAVGCWGPDDGYPVFLLHGTPGSRLGPRPRTRDLHLSGIRIIAYDRPGYGGSARLPGRSVAHAAADVEAIARDLGLPEFSVVGRSGGAPHALACAAFLPHVVRSVAILASLAPPDTEELSWSSGAWFDGMTQSNIDAFQLARKDTFGLRDELDHRRSAMNADPEQIIAGLDMELDKGDRRIVMETGIRKMLVKNFSAAFASGRDPGRPDGAEPPAEESSEASASEDGLYGWFDDVLSFVKPWGFDLSRINVPTLVWHGELDRFSPVGHFHWLAEHIEGATAIIEPDRAHFGAVQALPRVLRWLVTAGRKDGDVADAGEARIRVRA